MSPFVVRPTGDPSDDPHPEHAGEKFVFVNAGTVELDYADQAITHGAVDNAYFDASHPHKIRGVGRQRAEVLVVACR